jgi:hypothetical protein
MAEDAMLKIEVSKAFDAYWCGIQWNTVMIETRMRLILIEPRTAVSFLDRTSDIKAVRK